MTNIFVNLQALWGSAKDIQHAGNAIQQGGGALNAAGSSAPSYDGQFGPWVHAIAAEGNAQAKHLGLGVTDVGFRVKRRADAFSAVDKGAGLGSSRLASDILFRIPRSFFFVNLLMGRTVSNGLFPLSLRLLIWFFITRRLSPFIWNGRLFVGSVLAASVSDFQAKFSLMTWSQRLKERDRLREETAKLEAEIPDLDVRESEIDAKISELERRRREAKEQADEFWNQIKFADGRIQKNDGDGWPLWRTETDNYEDQIQRIDNELNELRQQKSEITNTRMEFARLQEELDFAQQKIDDGILASSTPEDKTAGFGGCTHYVAERFDVGPITGNAAMWNDNAPSDWVGETPIKGSVMVFEPKAFGAHATAGHVAFVESVVENENSYTVHISEANTVYDKDGNWVAGTHTTPTTRTIEIQKDGLGKDGVSFIYGPRDRMVAD
ncbi:MAG: CHAP domain-containing protein [Anaerolineales bacterium]|nr:CHAP domain-containing protein [Anaerolineales bacterium]